MDHAVLVDMDVNAGAEIIELLDAAHVAVSVALFATFTDYYAPRLVFAAPWLDAYDPLAKYGKLGEILRGRFPDYRVPPLLLLKMSDPFIEELRAIFSQTKDVRGMRLGSQLFGGRFLEDGYVYRIQ